MLALSCIRPRRSIWHGWFVTWRLRLRCASTAFSLLGRASFSSRSSTKYTAQSGAHPFAPSPVRGVLVTCGGLVCYISATISPLFAQAAEVIYAFLRRGIGSVAEGENVTEGAAVGKGFGFCIHGRGCFIWVLGGRGIVGSHGV
jgi:hypothetical protein